MSTADFLTSPSDHFPKGPLQPQTPTSTAYHSPAKGLEVKETGRSVRVETEKPHLVSLGGGRLSTAVTIHPLPEGRTYIGSESEQRKQDVLVEGSGVESEHCFIENVHNVVTIHPVAPMVNVDGVRITEPKRLAQGSMICLGLSTFFRFNHPQEARRMKQSLPTAFQPTVSASSQPVLEDSLLPDHSGTLGFPSSLQSLESSDFVEKVSKFEYLAHSRPATVTSQDTPKWLVREGLRIPSTPPPARGTSGRLYRDHDDFDRNLNRDGLSQLGSKSLPLRNCSVTLPSRTKPTYNLIPPASPGLRRVQESSSGSRSSPVQFWSGRCTPTLSHLGEGLCGHEDHLRACEDELKKQHRKAVQERLKEEEQVKQEQHRLEEILNMCAEYENQEKLKKEKKHKRTPSGFQPSPNHSGSVHQSPNHTSPVVIPNISGASKPPSNSFVYSSSPLSYNNNLPHHHLAHHQNRIKTNGSLPRERSQALQQSTEYSDSASPQNLQKSVNSASSEDELNEILGDNSQILSRSPGDCFEPHQNTSPHLGTVSLKYPHSPRTNHRVAGNQIQAQIEVYEQRHSGSELRTRNLGSNLSNPNSPNISKRDTERFQKSETYQEINEDLRRLCKLKVAYVRQISSLKKAFANFEAQENELLRELEMEHALITGELKDEERILMVDQKRLECYYSQDLQMLEEAEKAKSDEQDQLESAKQQLYDREERVRELRQKIKESGSQEKPKSEEGQESSKELEESYKRELELMEAEKKAFEDLEFQQLESQSHRDEDKEALANSIAEQVLVIQERKDRRLELEVQQKQLQEQINSERELFQSKMKKVSESLIEVQVKLESLDSMLRQLTRVDPLSNLDSSPDSSPRSSRSELPAHVPRQINESQPQAAQINGNDSTEDWREVRDAACRSFHSVDSESSSIISSDTRGDSFYNSSGDRSRPSSFPTENLGANRDLYLSSPDDSSADSDVKKREQLLCLQDDKPLLESPKKTSDGEVTRRDKQKTQRPLTRYLPIRSQEFDLRQHVESDGHQIELCPHVTLTSSTCSGTLHKLGGKWHAWKKRWFVFDRARRALLYYTDRKETKLRGGAYFQSIQEVYVDHLQSVKSPNPQSTFCMKTRDRIYYLMAPSPEAMRIWVDVIFTGAEGYLEFRGD